MATFTTTDDKRVGIIDKNDIINDRSTVVSVAEMNTDTADGYAANWQGVNYKIFKLYISLIKLG